MLPQLNEKKPSRVIKKTKNSVKTQPVEVFCRLRPIKNIGDRKVIQVTNEQSLQVSTESQSNQIYKFRHIFNEESSQKDVFDKIAFPLVNDWFHRQNGLLFTYGVTSAGKTYTITGKPKNPGILPRVLDLAFNTLKKTDLQSRKYSFKSNGYNGFVVASIPDAMLEEQNDMRKNTSKKKEEESLLGEWSDRERHDEFLKDLNHDYKYSIFVSYVENYNKYVYDLLDDKNFDQLYPLRNASNKPCGQKQIRENTKKQVYVQDLTEIEVSSAEEAFAFFLKGNQRKRMASTNLNADSSRSHSIFTLRLVQAPLNLNGTEVLPEPSDIFVTQLSIVDLAGCERTQRTGATGYRLKEASNINNSLLTLRSCFEALRENQKNSNSRKLIPYRDSRLTWIFKSFFEGGGQVKMIICLNPGAQDLDETLNVLKFGELSQEIMTVKQTDPLAEFQFDPGLKFQKFAVLRLPPWPEKWLDDPADDQIMQEWQMVNEQRTVEKKKMEDSYIQEMNIIRDGILNLNRESVLLRQENARLNSDFATKDETNRQLQDQIATLQREKDKDQRNVRLMQKNIDELQKKFSAVENHRSKILNDYELLKENIETFFESHRKETSKIIGRMMKNKEEKLREMECINKKKLEIAAKILEDDDEDLLKSMKNLSAERIWNQIYENTRQTRSKRFVNRSASAVGTKVKQFEREICPLTEDAQEVDEVLFSNGGHPVANPKFATAIVEGKEKWIDHRPPGTIELGTVMQPVLKNSKSVTELKSKDITGRTNSKYVLTHHDADVNGLVETQLFKGDVVPTTFGGAQVIFNDIEKLTQDSPLKTGNKMFDCVTPGMARKRILELEGGSNATTPIRSESSDHSSVPMSCVAKRLRSRVPMSRPRWA